VSAAKIGFVQKKQIALRLSLLMPSKQFASDKDPRDLKMLACAHSPSKFLHGVDVLFLSRFRFLCSSEN
jgi:hypothetical protein